MTERKPSGVGFEHWIDRQIREAQERGEFDNLAGAGKPLPGIDRPYDEMQWVANWVRREGLSTEAMLPVPLQLRKEIEQLDEAVRDLASEAAVREVAETLNRRIRDWIPAPSDPPVPVVPVDVDRVVQRWEAGRSGSGGDGAAAAGAAAPSASAADATQPTSGRARRWRTRWWRRTR